MFVYELFYAAGMCDNRCSDGTELTVPPVRTLVMVLDAEVPTITVNGIRSQAVDEYDLSHGVHLFPDLVIDATTKTEHNERTSDGAVRSRLYL